MKFNFHRKVRSEHPTNSPPVSVSPAPAPASPPPAQHAPKSKSRGRRSLEEARAVVESAMARASLDLSSRKAKAKKPRAKKGMVKRRMVVPISVFDRPMTTHVEFLVDPRYSKLNVIGSGSFGIVASAVDANSGGQRVAIKKIMATFASSRSARYVLREVRLLRHLRHPNIVSLLDIDVPTNFRAWDDVYIVTPLLRTDLRSALNDHLLHDPIHQKHIAFQLLSGLAHMHALGVMHRDVKTRNVLLSDDLSVAQLCDLGHSRFYRRRHNKPHNKHSLSSISASSHSSSGSSSPDASTLTLPDTTSLAFNHDEHDDEYNDSSDDESRSRGQADLPELTSEVTTMIQSAPEISLDGGYDAKVDVWAAGCVIGEIVNPSSTLFDSTGRRSHLAEIVDVIGFPSDEDLSHVPEHAAWFLRLNKKSKGQTTQPKIAERLTRNNNNRDNVDAQVVDLITSMLQFNPRKRPSARKALQHPWFDEVRHVYQNNNNKDPKPQHYNFAESEPPRKTSKSELKALVWDEVMAFHPDAAA